MSGRPYHHGDLRRQLIATARARVEADGAHNVSLAEIAEQCGVSVAAPYRHFPGKEALLTVVADEGFADLGAALAAASAPPGSARDRLIAAGVAYVEFALAHPHLFRLMFSVELRSSLPEAGPKTLGGLTTLVAGLDLAVPPETAVRTTWALAHGMASLHIGGMKTFTDETSHDRLAADFAALLDGITTPTPDARSRK